MGSLPVFKPNDRNNFVERLGSILIDTSTFCYACALIPNHLLLGDQKVRTQCHIDS